MPAECFSCECEEQPLRPVCTRTLDSPYRDRKQNDGLSRAEILNLSTEKSWKDNSIHIILNGMLKKGAIREDGFARSGKVWGRLYAPAVGIGEYYRENLFQPGGEEAYPLLLSAMVDDEDLSPETLDKLEEILRRRRERMQ